MRPCEDTGQAWMQAVGGQGLGVSPGLLPSLPALPGLEELQSEAGLSTPFLAGIHRDHRASRSPTPSLTGPFPHHPTSTYCVPGPGDVGLQVSWGAGMAENSTQGPGGSGGLEDAPWPVLQGTPGRRGLGPFADGTDVLLSLHK